jgi:hypothetical protein
LMADRSQSLRVSSLILALSASRSGISFSFFGRIRFFNPIRFREKY